jgi:hypothetical protein
MPITTMFRLARWGTLSFVVLTGVAMALYPGGTLRNPSTDGYRFLHQFGSDLGMSRAWNGQSNRLGAGVFVVGELALAAAIGALFTGMVSIAASGRSRLLARVAGAAGILAGIGFVITAFTAPDRFPVLHVQSAALAFRAACVAALLVTGVIILDPRFTRRTALSTAGMAVLLFAFVGVSASGPGVETDRGLVLQVAVQKIVVLAALSTLWYVSREAERVSNSGRSAPAEKHPNAASEV